MSNKAKLTCSLTGNTRQSSHKYIAKKAEQYGIDSETFQKYYVSKSAYLEFKQSLESDGITVVLAAHDMNEDTANKILQYNGKSQKTLSDFTQNVTAETQEAPVEQTEESNEQVEMATA